jgi:hypothetical protein
MLPGMRFFSKQVVSPKNALLDFKDMFTGPRPHKWPLLGLAMAVTGIILWGFYHDSKAPKLPREIIYVESWMADRKDSMILERQKADLAIYEAALEKKQKEFQHVADLVGLEWRKDEARNRAQRLEVLTAVNKQLDAKIAAAKAREAGLPAPATKTAAAQKQ